MELISLHPVVLLLVQWTVCSAALSIEPSALRTILIHSNLPIIYLFATTSLHYIRAPWAGVFSGALAFNYHQLLALALASESSTKYIPKGRASSYLTRLKKGLSLLLDWRRILHPPTNIKIPRFPHASIRSKSSFLSHHLLRLAVAYLLLDALSLQPLPADRTPFGPDKVPFFTKLLSSRNQTISPEDLITRFAITVVFWFNLYVLIQALASSCFLFIVSLNLVSYETCRPMFGPVTSLTSIRNFWGTFWHQLLRFQLTTLADHFVHGFLRVPEQWKLVSRYAKIMVVFALSGEIHLIAGVASGTQWTALGPVQFFVMQGLGIMFEDAVGYLYRFLVGGASRKAPSSSSTWMKILGGTWLLLWLVWTTPCWMYPQLRIGDDTKLIPYSVLLLRPTT